MLLMLLMLLLMLLLHLLPTRFAQAALKALRGKLGVDMKCAAFWARWPLFVFICDVHRAAAAAAAAAAAHSLLSVLQVCWPSSRRN